jgi:hypothetical protein
MVTTVNDSYRSALLAEKHLTVLTHDVEDAVNEHSSCAESAPEGFLPIETEGTVAVNGGAVQGIVGTLEVTTVVT